MNDREKLIELLTREIRAGAYFNRPRIEGFADYLIANGVVMQKQGEWEDKPTGRYRQMQTWCSSCGQHSGIGGIEKNRHKPFCPNCGAKMKEVK